MTSLLNNHYHPLGYNKFADNLGEMMRKIHGSVAKLVNDLLPEKRVPFWGDPGHQDYFDGCIRSEKQCRRAYRYTLTQSDMRHGFCADWRTYPSYASTNRRRCRGPTGAGTTRVLGGSPVLTLSAKERCVTNVARDGHLSDHSSRDDITRSVMSTITVAGSS